VPIYSASQQQLAETIDSPDVTLSNWRDWRWQLKHSIQDIETVEELLGTRFNEP
jgi:lysine 2,3-aminomutase